MDVTVIDRILEPGKFLSPFKQWTKFYKNFIVKIAKIFSEHNAKTSPEIFLIRFRKIVQNENILLIFDWSKIM